MALYQGFVPQKLRPSGGYTPSWMQEGSTELPPESMESSNPLFGGLDRFEESGSTKRTTGRPTPAGKTWFSDILNQRLPSTDRPHMTPYTRSSASSGGVGSNIPYGSKSYWQPKTGMSKPTMGALPEYMMPTIDQGRISELTEKAMGGQMGKLRRGLSSAELGTRGITNPNVRAQMLRELLSGFGEGISDVRTGAGREAISQYMPEFQAATQKAGAEYQAGVSRVQSQFQADLADYMKRGIQTTTPVQGRYEGSTRKPIRWG